MAHNIARSSTDSIYTTPNAHEETCLETYAKRAHGFWPGTADPHSSQAPMSQVGAIRYVAGTKKSPLAALLLQCHVKPGAKKSREGVTSLTDDAVELCVAAQAREGEANKAVVAVLSSALGLPKSDLTITHGLKSRDKTVAIKGSLTRGTEAEAVLRVKELLDKASEDP